MNFHKSIPILYTRVFNSKNKKEANEIIKSLLHSYHIQIEAGINRLDAFDNSIMNPSVKDKNINEKELLQKTKNPKFLFLFKNEECIQMLRKGGVSLENVAKYLNSHKTPKRRRKNQEKISINKMDLSRFLKFRSENA